MFSCKEQECGKEYLGGCTMMLCAGRRSGVWMRKRVSVGLCVGVVGQAEAESEKVGKDRRKAREEKTERSGDIGVS